MPLERFFIAPLNSGLQQNVKPWLIMDDAFAELRNAYNWRGSVKKRFGSRVMNGCVTTVEQQLFTRLRINIGTTAAVTGNFGAFVVPGTIFKIGQMFSIGTTIFTVHQNGGMFTTGTATGTYNTGTGSVTITGNNENAATAIFFYPADSVMHLGTYNLVTTNDEELFAFDTQFSYRFVFATGWNREATEAVAGDSVWTGTNSDFHWSTNYRGANADDFILFVTNNRAADAMRFWNNTQWATFGTAATTPINLAGDFIKTCRVILPFKNRLLLMNTTENLGAADSVFLNRIRYSQIGNPLAVDAWREDIPGKGLFIDSPASEAIISAEFIKDRLIVFFEESTWEVVYTGNAIAPFRFQQLNTELGVESTNSIVAFDKAVLGLGQKGIHACNGMNVERIDDTIPDEIFGIVNDNNGPRRVQGIRDFWTELVYWTYNTNLANNPTTGIFPNRVLVYNYENGSWSINDDTITALGNFYNEVTLTWADIERGWQDMDEVWHDPSLQSNFRSVIGGNQEGFTFLVDAESNRNSMSLQITDIAVAGATVTITAIDHNIPQQSFIYINNVQGTLTIAADLNNRIYKVSVVDADTFTIVQAGVTGVYSGGGILQLVSKIDIRTKDYNFYNQVGLNASIQAVSLFVDSTPNGQMVVDFIPSSSSISIITDGLATNTQLGSSIIQTNAYATVPLEATQTRFWRDIFPYAEGETVQMRLFFNDALITNVNVAFSDFQLNAMIFSVQKTNLR